MRSKGYNKIVEADPPAKPARKEDRGEVLVDDGVVGCWHCCVRVDDDDDDAAASPESIFGSVRCWCRLPSNKCRVE
jgi:hypothetical protein